MTSRTVRLCDGTVDIATGRVLRAGGEHRLTTLEARLLDHVAAHAGRDVPRTELQDKVWGYGPNVQTRAMDHTVARLRAKIEIDPRSPRHLITVHGIGYRFVPVDVDGSRSIHPAPPALDGSNGDTGAGAALASPEPPAPQDAFAALAPEERAALAAASVFRGGFSSEAADAVISGDAAAVLDRLRDLALVQVAVTRGELRYELPDPVRARAEAELAPTARAAAERAHASYFLDRAFAGDDHDLGRLADEQANLLAVHDRFVATDPAIAIRAILVLDPLYYARGPGHHHVELLSQAVAVAPRGELLSAVLLARAEAWGALGDVDVAERDVDRALEAAGDEPDLVARALIARGNLRRRQARFDEAYALYEQALASAGRSEPRALALRQLAGVDIEVGRFSLALQRFRDLEERHRSEGNTRGVAAVLGVQGNIHSELGELARAERCFLGAIDLSRRVLDRRREGIALSNLAVVLHERGQLDEARAAWERSLAMHREVVNRRFEGFAAGGLGVLLHEAGLCDEARLLATEALAIFREVGDRRFEMIGRARLAVLGPSGAEIRDELAALGAVSEADASAIRVLSGFADLADARAARDRDDAAEAADALARARAACALRAASRPTSFHRISVRVLTAWLGRWPHG